MGQSTWGDHKAQMAARWLWVVLVVAGAASVSVTDEVGSTSRLLNADLDQSLMSVLGREDVRLAVRNVKVDSASRRPLADLQMEIDLGMADLGGDDLGMANLLTSEEDLGEERRFDFEPNKEEAQNMDVQKILGYDKLLDETEANYLAATDIVIKSKLKWQTDSIMNLLRAACTRYIQILKPELWSPLKQKLRTAKYTVFVTFRKLQRNQKKQRTRKVQHWRQQSRRNQQRLLRLRRSRQHRRRRRRRRHTSRHIWQQSVNESCK